MATATKTRKATTKGRKLTKEQRLAELKSAISLAFNMMSHMTHAEVAARTGLCLATVYRLWHGDFSLRTHFGTVQAMCYAAGLRLTVSDSDVTISLVD